LPKALAFKLAKLVKLDDALEKANTIVALVDHKEFRKISANTLNSKMVIDTRGAGISAGAGLQPAISA
jgi:UDP-N-acetyl-D-mannosaminuronic acid dehydrogenase